MTDPGGASGAVAEVTLTAGTGPYQLSAGPPGGPLAQYFRFADVFVDGAIITYEVDDTAKKEIVEGTFNLGANTLSRDTVLFSSNDNALIDWPATGQRIVRPLVAFPLCDTPPTDGQILVWDAAIQKYCPTTITDDDTGEGGGSSSFPLCATPPTDGQVLIWNGTEWCPADLCALVEACLNPPPLGCNWAWAQQDAVGSGAWLSSAISNNGAKMAVAQSGKPGVIWLTADRGATWVSKAIPTNVYFNTDEAIAISGDGTRIFLCSSGGINTADGLLYMSADNGATWNNISPPLRVNEHLAVSSNGQHLIVGTVTGSPPTLHPGYVYTSLDGGATWVQQVSLGLAATADWNVAISADGNTMAVTDDNQSPNFVAISRDAGATWSVIAAEGTKGDASIRISSNGGVMVTVPDFDSRLRISLDGGASFNDITASGPFWRFGMGLAGDGTTIVASDNQHMHISCDQGVTWATQSPLGSWRSVAISGDGTTIIANEGSALPWVGTRS